MAAVRQPVTRSKTLPPRNSLRTDQLGMCFCGTASTSSSNRRSARTASKLGLSGPTELRRGATGVLRTESSKSTAELKTLSSELRYGMRFSSSDCLPRAHEATASSIGWPLRRTFWWTCRSSRTCWLETQFMLSALMWQMGETYTLYRRVVGTYRRNWGFSTCNPSMIRTFRSACGSCTGRRIDCSRPVMGSITGTCTSSPSKSFAISLYIWSSRRALARSITRSGPCKLGWSLR
mmetsp:Transcript_58261/g.103965  ORF Transcript_58261/g.103965 Transcript_58261/m.103965 type:complete len:235 (-) Transcript_58261:1452-2156(-)